MVKVCSWLALAVVLVGCERSLEKGRICLEQGDWERACRFYAQAVDRDPSDLEARRGLGKALLQKSQALEADKLDRAADWDAAVRELSIAMAGQDDSILTGALYQARLQAARAMARAGDTGTALVRLEGLSRAWPAKSSARNFEAVLRFRRGEYEKALVLFQENVRLDSNDVSACFNLGLLSMHTGRSAQATEYLLRAARLAPEDPEILYWLGKVAGAGP